jgi:hypothetical protein
MEKRVVRDKVKGLGNKGRRFQIEKVKNTETDITVDIEAEGNYDVEKLDVDVLPRKFDGKTIVWFNNFSIKRGGQYIKQKYTVTIPDLRGVHPVICDGSGKVFYYEGEIENGDTITLTDGDPGIGKTT